MAAISYVDTTEVDSISKEILSLTNQLNSEINDLYTRFSEVTGTTEEWVGQKAEFYFSKVALDKKQYIDLIEQLRNIAYKLSSDMIDTQTCIKKNKSEEEKED